MPKRPSSGRCRLPSLAIRFSAHDPADGVANFPISATRINDNVASRIDVNERPTACSGDDSHRLPELSLGCAVNRGVIQHFQGRTHADAPVTPAGLPLM